MLPYRSTTQQAVNVRPTLSPRFAQVPPPSPPPTKPDFREGSILEERESASTKSVTPTTTGLLRGGSGTSNNTVVTARYRVGKLLGRGGFAKCYEVFPLTDTNDSGGVFSSYKNEAKTGKSNCGLACKVVDRTSLTKPKTLQKLHSEISIHKRMKHANIVTFLKTFQDEWFVYILLEKCVNQTLMEISKTRPRFSQSETQHIAQQSISALMYMHHEGVIHRDLKLGNMMMDVAMNVKLGDFGLAAELQYDGERKRTICGTPNYIAPEILEGSRDGHSFEVDVWSFGVILYTLLVGEPPFQTSDVKTTYHRIKHCRYTFPAGIQLSDSAKDLIQQVLQSKPECRPTLSQIKAHSFFSCSPSVAPVTLFSERQRRAWTDHNNNLLVESCPQASCEPVHYNKLLKQPAAMMNGPTTSSTSSRVPFALVTNQQAVIQQPTSCNLQPLKPTVAAITTDPHRSAANMMKPQVVVPIVNGWCATNTVAESAQATTRVQETAASSIPIAHFTKVSSETNFKNDKRMVKESEEEDYKEDRAVHEQLHRTLLLATNHNNDPNRIMKNYSPIHAAPILNELPQPTVWVTDYADFSGKYGLAYKLSSGQTAVHFNDSTKMSWDPMSNVVEYYARIKECGITSQAVDQRSSFMMENFPEPLSKKITLIKYFRSYLSRSNTTTKKEGGIEVVNCCPFWKNKPTTASNVQHPSNININVYVKRWLLTPKAIIFRLSNKTIQVCFFPTRSAGGGVEDDAAEVILCAESKVISYADAASGKRITLPLSAVPNYPNPAIAQRLQYTKDILSRLISNREL